MEFPFIVDKILPDEVNIVNGEYVSGLRDKESISQMQQVIDRVGQLSAKAQGLHVPVTTFSKLRVGDDRTYLLRDPQKDSRCVIGLLKVGFRKLFLHDVRGVQHEMCPLAVLDFYIHETRQRHGHGRKLFDYMIQNENILPQHLAIDRPSPKMLGFLGKHYDLKHAFLQPNSYAVFEGFFTNRSDYKANSARNLPFKPNQRAGSMLSATPTRIGSAVSNTSTVRSKQQTLAATETHSPQRPGRQQPYNNVNSFNDAKLFEEPAFNDSSPPHTNARAYEEQARLPPTSPLRSTFAAPRESAGSVSVNSKASPDKANAFKQEFDFGRPNFGQKQPESPPKDFPPRPRGSQAAINTNNYRSNDPFASNNSQPQRNGTSQAQAFQLRRERSSDEIGSFFGGSQSQSNSAGKNQQRHDENSSQYPAPAASSLNKAQSYTDLRNNEVPKKLKTDHVTQQQIDSLLDRLHEAHLSRNKGSANSGVALPPPHPLGNQNRSNNYQNSRTTPTRNAQQNKNNTTFWSIFGVN